MNVGGFTTTAIDYAGGELGRLNADVCVFSETKLSGALSVANLATQLSTVAKQRVRLWAVNGPPVLDGDGLPCTSRQHGVAIAVADGSILVRELSRHPHGLIALALRRRGKAEILLVGTYLPPATSFAKERRLTLCLLYTSDAADE